MVDLSPILGRQGEIDRARQVQQRQLDIANKKARSDALKKKGNQNCGYQSIQGVSDFGAGNAGPGIPYSIATTQTPEAKTTPPHTATRPPWAPPQAHSVLGSPLWTVGNLSPSQATDWRMMAIRRRLNNG